MKKIVKLFLLLILVVTSVNSNTSADSVEYSIEPRIIEVPYIDSLVDVCILNYSSDTLVTISDIFIQGGSFEQTIVHPIGKSSPNFLFLKSKDLDYFFVDGFFDVNYYEFPQMIVIPPNSKRVMRVNIKSYLKLNHNNWELSGFIKFAAKPNLDYIVANYYSERIQEYVNSLSYADSILSNVFPVEKIDSVYKFIDKPNLNRIQDAFE